MKCPSMKRFCAFAFPLSAITLGFALFTHNTASAGPQHWGFGFSYLAVIEEVDGQSRLVVYEPPMHCRDFIWPARWLDRTTVLDDVASGGIAVGDFWPEDFGKEYLVTVADSAGQLAFDVYAPPEIFATRQWEHESSSGSNPVTGTFLGATAGDLIGGSADELLVALDTVGNIKIAIFTPPSAYWQSTWTLSAEATLPGVTGAYLGVTAGDFWGDGHDYIAIATDVSDQTELAFYEYDGGSNSFAFVVADAAALPPLQMNGLTSADYLKDDFDLLTLVPPTGDFELRVAPARPGDDYDLGPEYTGKSLAGVEMPGNGGAESVLVMSGTWDTSPDSRVAFGSGRVFGYVDTALNQRFAIDAYEDAQISFVHRTPRKDQRPPYGWPSLGETTTWEINVGNQGALPIPPGYMTLKIWVNSPTRNPDTHPDTCDAPDYEVPISQQLVPFDHTNPQYWTYSVSFPWPYDLEQAGPLATWQRINIETVGERWIVAKLEGPWDLNERNNRYEIPVHGITFHPCFRSNNVLADRQPTVQGDPSSIEYLSRKLADAVQCMWERSRTRDGEPVPQRLWFDSYQTWWPDDQPDRDAAWQEVQSKYEGWRQLDGWWGHNQWWERFDWGDGGAELHETGHLFHPIGDLYQYYISPVWTSAAKMYDDTPVQIRTWMWPADSYGSGHARITWPACELMKRHLAGARNWNLPNWLQIAPDQLWVRVLDRNGDPVPGAEINVYRVGYATPEATGVTGADGRWELTPMFGSYYVDDFGMRHYYNGAYQRVYTVNINNVYKDAQMPDTDGRTGHSHHTWMGHALTDTSGWTWDFHTLYEPGVPEPDFTVTAAVNERVARLGITGDSGATYRVYRRWEPAWFRVLLGEFTATGDTAIVEDDMAAQDSFGGYRFRATYEVTKVTGDTESLPELVQVTGVDRTRGVSTAADGKLLVAANAGIANPWCQLFDGTTPYRELFYHFRFGHTGNRVVESKVTDGKYYATLHSSDTVPDYRFDLVEPPTGQQQGYDVRYEIGGFHAVDWSTSAPYWIRCQNETQAERYLPGDQLSGDAGAARITTTSGDMLYVAGPVCSGSSWVTGLRLAGAPGSSASQRELLNPRGLDSVLCGGGEYIVIADTGNDRVTIWEDDTRFFLNWTSPLSGANIAAIAAHPTQSCRFFVLDRHADRNSKLYLFYLDDFDMSLYPLGGYPIDVPVGDQSGLSEMGLAAAVDPISGNLLLHITDASQGRVLEYEQIDGVWQQTATYTQPIGVYAGADSLIAPTDVTLVADGDELRSYVVDNHDRVCLIMERSAAPPPGDLNEDRTVDFADFTLLSAWLSGPDQPVAPGEEAADLDDDGDADLDDMAAFQELLGA